jgi:3-phenylpropionate/trans-cinnamate dioxygenase ferredoxin reductase subunit
VRRIVIAGAGLAGHRAGLALRAAGFTGELTYIGDEPHYPYDRPPLSKQLITGVESPERLFFPTDPLDAQWLLGKPACHLDTERRTVTLSDNTSVHYDGLMIATGRRARSWHGAAPAHGVHTLRTLDDALQFRTALRADTRVVVIGAGFIGCEVASSLSIRGVAAVTLVDVAEHPMAALGSDVGIRAASLHSRHGVNLRMNRTVTAIDGTDHVEAVLLDNGESIAADVVLVAMGSEPNSQWLQGSGLTLSNGNVLCDSYGFAIGADNIVAAGDIATWPNPIGGKPMWVEHWCSARDMATLAATNLVSGRANRNAMTAVPTFWSDQYHVKIKSAGYLRAADRFTVIDEDEAKGSLVVEALSDDALVGAIAFNRNRTMVEYVRRLAAQYIAAAAL